jgi:hypothetical protein
MSRSKSVVQRLIEASGSDAVRIERHPRKVDAEFRVMLVNSSWDAGDTEREQWRAVWADELRGRR